MKVGTYSKKYRAAGVGGVQSKIKAVVIHSAESPANSAEGVSRYLETRTDGGAHFMLDDREGYRLAPDSRIAYGVGGYNTGVIHIEQAGYASWKTREWRKHPRQLWRVAVCVAQELRRHNLRPRRLKTKKAIFDGGGYLYHRDVSPYVTSTHTDPGPNYPTILMHAMIRFAYHHPKARRFER
jgi:hypothetical protein